MKKIIFSIVAVFIGGLMLATPVFADDCVQTSIIGNGQVCDSGNGDSIFNILDLVVNILTIGIGILGVIGITIVGIQYLTAGGSEEKTRKAKRRMFEIVIGLVAYVLIYAALSWLMPNFNSTDNNQNTTNSSQNNSQNADKLTDGRQTKWSVC